VENKPPIVRKEKVKWMNQLVPVSPKENSVFSAVPSRTTWVIVARTVARLARIGASIVKERMNDMFEPGTKVKIREDLIDGIAYGLDMFLGDMNFYKGKEAFIKKDNGVGFKLDIDNGEWTWTAEMLEKVTEQTKDVKEGQK